MDLSFLDFSTLEKGSVILPDVLEKITGTSRHDKRFGLACLPVRTAILAYFERERNVRVRLSMRGDALHVLTDLEMDDESHGAFRRKLRGLERDHDDALAVNVQDFNRMEKRRHERRLEIQSKIVSSILASKAELALKPAQRKTPL